MSETKTVREILLRAADILVEKGWCQRAFTDDKGQHCALGAIIKASATEEDILPAVCQEAQDALRAYVQSMGFVNVTHYNDGNWPNTAKCVKCDQNSSGELRC